MPWRKGNRLHTVAEQFAGPDTRAIYDEIKAALGLPGLQLYYPALGAYPQFLALHWETVRHIAARPQLFAYGECLRAEAYTRTHNYFRIPDLHSAPDQEQLLGIADFYHFMDAVTLLLFVFQVQAMEGPAGQPIDGASETQVSRARPKLVRDALPASIPEQDATAGLRRRYEEIRRTLATPFVGPELCAFAIAPEFFDAYWSVLTKMLGSPLYAACKHGIRSSSWALASQLPGPAELTLDKMSDAGLTAEDIASIGRIMELLIDYLTGALLTVAAAKIALEGGNLVVRERADASEEGQPAA